MRCFVDTNILVYTFDLSDAGRRAQASTLLEVLVETRTAVLSAQVLGEFYSAVTRKLRPPLDERTAAGAIRGYALSFPVLPVTAQTVAAAVEAAAAHMLSYWDAQVWASAWLAGCDVILTEDSQHGRSIQAVQFLNPFRRDFDIHSLLRD